MQKWTDQIDRTTKNFKDAFGHLNARELNWKPDEASWSIGQNIEHLTIINSSYFPALEELRNDIYRLPFLSKFGFIASFFGKTVLKAVQPDRKKRIKTFPIWNPSSSNLPSTIVDDFVQHQEELKQEILLSKNLILSKAVISSPANKNIFYPLSMAFDIIVAHEQRHFQQAKEVLSTMQSAQVE